MSVQEKMTAIADAIREKTGGTELIGLDEMAGAVADMRLSNGNYYFETATFAANTQHYTIQHDLGEVPVFACYFVFPLGVAEGQEWNKPSGMCWCAGYVMNKKIYLVKGQDGSVMASTGSTVCSAVSATETTFSPYLSFKGGFTYAFLVWR